MDKDDPDHAKEPALETPPPDTVEAAGSETAGTGTGVLGGKLLCWGKVCALC